MAIKVPSAASLGLGQVQNNNVPTVYQELKINPDAFGAQQGEQIQKLGQNMMQGAQVAAKIKDDQDTADAYSGVNKFDDLTRKSHYDGENAIYNRKGPAALTAYQDSEKAVSEAYVKATDGLNPQAQFKFDRLFAVKREGILNSSARFEAQQRNAYKADATQALVNNSIDDAVKNYNNPEVVRNNVSIIRDTIDQAIPALPENPTPEMVTGRGQLVKEKTSEALDKTYTGIIKKFAANGNTATAQSFYKAVKDDISGPNQIQLDAMLREGSIRGQAQAQFDKITGSGKSEADQLAAARSIKDPELRDEVEMRVKRSWNEPKTQQQRSKELASTEAWKMVVNGTDPSKIPLELWTTIDKDERTKIQRFATDGAPQKSSLLTYADLKDQYVNNPDQFKKANLFNYADKLNEQDFSYFSSKQKELLNEDRAGHIQTRTYSEIGKQRLEAMGIDTSLSNKTSDSDKKKSALFFRALDQQVEAFATENGRKPKESEVEQMIDKMTEQVAFDKGWFSRQQNKFKFEMDGSENLSDVVVPESARLEIIRQVQQLNPNAALTDAQIKQIYAKKLKK